MTNAELLSMSRARRNAYTFAAVAASHVLRRFSNMPTLPHEESKAPTLSYACSDTDMQLIFKIVDRAVEMAANIKTQHGVTIEIDRTIAAMDIATLHCNGTPIKLWQLLASDNEDFSHDFTMIGRFIDRRAGVLTGGARLRFAEKKQ